ncbi:MAG: homocysteine S-methyltransferase family protein [Myxococcales bacterium]
MQISGAQGLLARLEAGTPVVLDGGIRGALRRSGFSIDEGMGTAGVLPGQSQLLATIHESFCAAGVHVLRTNTVQTTPEALQRVGYGYRAAKLTSLAVDVAREVAESSGRAVCVAGMLPPMKNTDARLRTEQAAHAQRLAASGCDLIIVDAACSLREAVAATSAALLTGLPVLVSMRVLETGSLPDGEGLEAVCDALAGAGAGGFIAIPSDPAGELRAISALSNLARPWGVWQGGPTPLSPTAYAERAVDLVGEGATLLSGEDAVTPEHVRTLLEQVPEAQRELRRASVYPGPVMLRGMTNLPPRV